MIKYPGQEDDSESEKKSIRFSLRILNLPKKTKESYLRDSIRNEYKKYGTIKNIEIGEKEKFIIFSFITFNYYLYFLFLSSLFF